MPYVRRLLQLFPETEQSTKYVLSSDEVTNNVYQIETRHHVKCISQSPLDFKSKASSFREFLGSVEQKVLNLEIFKGDEWIGLVKVYQILQKAGCLIEGQYTLLK